MIKKKCTIMTPTFNRAYKLEKLYTSLKLQSKHDFEWLIVDDGSTDNTKELIDFWIASTTEFEIRYYKQENKGKHEAINLSLSKARGDYFFIVDSDDWLTRDAVKTIIHEFANIKHHKNKFAGIGFLRKYPTGEIIGSTFDCDYIDCTNLDREKNQIKGDKAEVFITGVLKQYRFPVFFGEKFLSEAIIWNKIAFDGYLIRWLNTPIYVCKYLPDGLTQNLKNHYIQSPLGYAEYLKSEIFYKQLTYLKRIYYYGLYYSTIRKYSFKKVSCLFETSPINVFLGTCVCKTYEFVRREK